MLSNEDKLFLQSKGMNEETVIAQLESFKIGFPFLKLYAAANVDNKGIIAPTNNDKEQYLAQWNEYLEGNGKVLKFVPASGAASRMFKNVFEFLDGESDTPDNDFMKTFFDEIHDYAFYADLNAVCMNLYGKDIDALIADSEYKKVVSALLKDNGLNYGKLPKGLLKFHKYSDTSRTPLEEHLVEGALYAKGKEGKVNVHFTVSPEHRQLFQNLVLEKSNDYAKQFGVEYSIGFSEQKSSTDTIAVDMNNEPFRLEDGKLLFRPGGHGALIENLNELDADIIFIKNIDNVVPDNIKGDTVENKKLIAGVLVSLQKKLFEYLRLLDSGCYTHAQIQEMILFLQHDLSCRNPMIKYLEDSELAIYLKKKFNRPIRVCGMVKNVGEPGGGPFLAYNSDGTFSPQILESSQIDKNNAEYLDMFNNGTHFNPVDLVCGVKNYKGEKFDLTQFVDKNTGFISYKSKNGKELKALELPGLWNGAMSDWNTVFVEVPLTTFNPVKTVNDLLRPQHQ